MEYDAPSEPPPLLNYDQVRHLAIHGWLPISLPEQLVADVQTLFSVSPGFFDQKMEDKRRLYPSSNGTECGFYVVPREKEYVTFRHAKASGSALDALAQAIWQQAAQILHRVLCDLSRAGSYDVHAWDHLVDGSLALPEDDRDLENIISLMRLFRYYPEAGAAEEHVDVGLVTLCVGQEQGLQVLDWNTKEYVDASGPTVLIGDMARVLLKNRVRAGMHRVVCSPHGRSSFVFALRPNLSHTTDLTQFGGRGSVNTKEFFYRIKGRKYNINATRQLRERQQRDAAQKSEEQAASTFGAG